MIAHIKFNKPSGADVDDIAQFILDALSSWGGGLHPEDPMFHSLKIIELTVHGRKFNLDEAYIGDAPTTGLP